MKIIVASDSFKGSLSSGEVAEACRCGIAAWAEREGLDMPEVTGIKVADGGEGTVEAIVEAKGGKLVEAVVMDPLGRPVKARYGLAGDTAVIEMAAASGLPLLSMEERNPELTSTFGTGQLIADAISRGARNFLIGIGGSATNDGGTGMLEALGYRFLDSSGVVIRACGGALSSIASIDSDKVLPELSSCTFTVACDVDTPFCGPFGAAYVFAAQKGADPAMVERLDAGLEHFADIVDGMCCASDTHADSFRKHPGSGAAGGLGGAFLCFLKAKLVRGVEMVLKAIDFDSLIAGADLVITGEGRMDAQTPLGKTPAGVLSHATAQGIPAVAICGSLSDCPELRAMGFKAICQVTADDMPLDQALDPTVASCNVSRAMAALMKKNQTDITPRQL